MIDLPSICYFPSSFLNHVVENENGDRRKSEMCQSWIKVDHLRAGFSVYRLTSQHLARDINIEHSNSMAPRSKGKTKAPNRSSFAHIIKPSLPQPPAPFSQAPSNLEPFLSRLSKKHVYITSVDKMPWQFKAQIFAVPLAMNIAIIGVLLWRLCIMGPYYFKIFSSLMGNPNETTMYIEYMTKQQTAYAVATRTLKFLADFALYLVLWPWPRAFFDPSDSNGPVAWRFSIGFKDQEITVRRSRRWDEILEDVVTEGGEGSEGGRMFLIKVRQATSRGYMHEKTGYSMLNKDWDLDWRLMILATKMVDKEEMKIDDFKTTVLIHSTEYGWVIFEARVAIGESDKEVEGRKKILAFKDELTAMGKENLFFRWIELIQYESSQPEGFGPERQKLAMLKAKEMFEAQGVDFENFWAKIGGMEGMPGMDQS